MNGVKILNSCAVLALVLALAAPAASSAESHGHKGKSAGAVRTGDVFHAGKGHRHNRSGEREFVGGAPAARFSDGDPGYPGYHGTFISGSVVGAMGFYDNGYYEDGPAAVVQGPGGGRSDAAVSCMQTYKSYEPRSGTYLGYDSQRHPCP